MMIIQGIIELGYNIRSAWFLDIRISTCFLGNSTSLLNAFDDCCRFLLGVVKSILDITEISTERYEGGIHA